MSKEENVLVDCTGLEQEIDCLRARVVHLEEQLQRAYEGWSAAHRGWAQALEVANMKAQMCGVIKGELPDEQGD